MATGPCTPSTFRFPRTVWTVSVVPGGQLRKQSALALMVKVSPSCSKVTSSAPPREWTVICLSSDPRTTSLPRHSTTVMCGVAEVAMVCSNIFSLLDL